MKTRHKQAKDENFPVGSLLIDKKLRPLVAQYYRFARYADDIADNPKLSMKDKLLQLGEMEDDNQNVYGLIKTNEIIEMIGTNRVSVLHLKQMC